MNNARILILDAESNAALSLLQALGSLGYKTCLAGISPDALGRHSRYCQRFFLYPDPLESKNRFIAWFSEFTSVEAFDLILPVTDITLYPLIEYADRKAVKGIVLPPRDTFEFFFNKAKTLDLAKECDVPFPETRLLRSNMPIESFDWQFPSYVKPVRSKVWNGDRGIELDARLIHNAENFEKTYRSLSPHCDVLVQDYVRGRGVGIEIFSVQGDILLSFAHRRIHEYPLTGGGSTYRVSIEMPQRLFQFASRLVKRIRWTGVAMVEFKDDGEHAYLMEVNGRFWGSLPLSVRAGMNFPKAVVEWELARIRPTAGIYRIGFYSRKLSMDIAWFKRNLMANRNNPFLITRPIIPTVFEFFRIFIGKEYWDHASWKDPGPMLAEMKRIILRLMAPIVRKSSTIAFRLLAPLILLSEKRRSKATLSHIAPRKILFVCYGNICRSPFAEKLSSALLPANVFEVRSCGFIPDPDRKSPREFQKLTQRFGVDLGNHRSKKIDESLCSWADIIVIMDFHNWLQLKRFWKNHIGKTVWLGSWGNDSSVEIPDPFGKPDERMNSILHHIYQSCTRLADDLKFLAGT